MKRRRLGLLLMLFVAFGMVLPTQASTWTDYPGYTESADAGGAAGDTVLDGDLEGDLSGKTVNLSLIIDATGSMGGYIYNVVENLSDFVRYIESTGVNFRLSLIEYRDITCGEATVVHTFDHSVWSQSTEQIISEMQGLYAEGGGDYPETLIDALGYLVDESVMTFNSNAAIFAIVLTDAEYKEDNIHGIASMDDMIAALQAKGIRVSVMTDEYCFSEYTALTEATGGILCPVDDFAEALREYAVSIINATAVADVDASVRSVTGVSVEGPSEIHPNYAYTYNAVITPADATDKGVSWYTEDGTIANVISTNGSSCQVRGNAEGSTRLIAVTRDGGYTYAVDISVSNGAPISDTIVTHDYNAIQEALGEDVVKRYEYQMIDGTAVTPEQQAEIFSGIRDTDKNFTFFFLNPADSGAYTWNFLGSNVTNETQAMDFGIIPDAGNEAVLGMVEEDVEKMDIHFAHSGSLPGAALVTVPVKDAFTTNTLYLYYYNAEAGTLELASENVIAVNGYAVFPLGHCSDYILTSQMLRSLIPEVRIEEKTEPAPENTYKSPKTGDAYRMMTLALLTLSLTGFVLCGRKARQAKTMNP